MWGGTYEDEETPSWAQPWAQATPEAAEEEDDLAAGAGRYEESGSRSPEACVIDMESGPSTSYSYDRPSRAANRYGSSHAYSPGTGSNQRSKRPFSLRLDSENGYEARRSTRSAVAGPPRARDVGGSRDSREEAFIPSAPTLAGAPPPPPAFEASQGHDLGLVPRVDAGRKQSTPPGVPFDAGQGGSAGARSSTPQRPRGEDTHVGAGASSAVPAVEHQRQKGKSIGLNPLQENATLRLLTYEACLRLCFMSGSAGGSQSGPRRSGSSISEGRYFLEDGFHILQTSFGVDKIVLQPLSKQHRKGSRALSGPNESQGRVGRQQEVSTSVHLNLMFTEMKQLGGKKKGQGDSAVSAAGKAAGTSGGQKFLHSLGKKLRPSGKGKSLYCHVRLSSKVDEEYQITKVGSQNLVSLEIFSSDGSGSQDAGQNRYSAEDVLEIVVKNKQDVSIGYASMAISSTIDTEVNGRTQIHNLPVRSQQGDIIGSLSMTTRVEKQVNRKKVEKGVEEDLKSQEMEFDANRGYDVLLQVALAANNFKQRHLLITKPWHFLLNKFASEYNISTTTCILQFLKWVVRAATPTSECMDILCQLLPRIMKEKHQADLPIAEQNMLSQILQNVEELLAKSFQCIKSLSEKESNGVLTGYQIVPKDLFPSPVIPKVLYLYSQMHDLLAPSSQKKLIMHLQAAASLRFGRIKRDAIDSCSGEQRVVGEGIDYLAASKIFDALRVELEYDQILHHSEVLPAFVNFPEVSNEVYAEKLYEHLRELLVTNPPTDFSDALDSLFRSASLYETSQSKFSLSSPKDKSVFVLFSDHVETWICRDCTWLCAKLTQKEISQEIMDIERALSNHHFSDHADSHLPHQSYQLYMIPLFKKSGGVFDKIQAFLNKYSGIVKRWPDWVPVLETSCCKILRSLLYSLNDASAAAVKQSHAHDHQRKHSITSPGKMFGYKKPNHFTSRLLIPDAVLLNAQRQMLSFIPKLRSSVSVLSSGVPTQKDTFKNGTIFRHVEEEVRTSYAQTTQKFVLSLSEAPCHRLKKILKEQSKAKLNDCEDSVRDLLKPYLTLIEAVLADHRVMLTPKVWRDLCRGMWDLAAAEVLKFVERIHNDKENATRGGFHVRVMTSEVSSILESFFQQGLHQVLGSDVHERDLQTPFSAKRLRERICGGNPSLSASDSFSVY
ncbi:hypothetical protein HOP50_06g46190 [Chloropicon primus]|uniref:Uncharacterized protein n=1 Tax=Chloropicon primus TaxID=1764295 RepID=A0A5B8MN48_9CHLO|nr:hypothetical protein A3770_06p45960 [Chloropicon primus]UPR01297.1 hypothetical protein HOP50_06g46190 [Chloropicon primus]|eukprot:QDZ22078.1 hypothetical protein A3770_06p45960 [Chloropicon primus]